MEFFAVFVTSLAILIYMVLNMRKQDPVEDVSPPVDVVGEYQDTSDLLVDFNTAVLDEMDFWLEYLNLRSATFLTAAILGKLKLFLQDTSKFPGWLRFYATTSPETWSYIKATEKRHLTIMQLALRTHFLLAVIYYKHVHPTRNDIDPDWCMTQTLPALVEAYRKDAYAGLKAPRKDPKEDSFYTMTEEGRRYYSKFSDTVYVYSGVEEFPTKDNLKMYKVHPLGNENAPTYYVGLDKFWLYFEEMEIDHVG